MTHKFMLGSDPEIFLADAAGALVAACGKIGGSKSNPMPLRMLGDGYAVQEDNVAVEFNIPPASTPEELKLFLKNTVDHLSEIVGQDHGLHFVNLSAASFPDSELEHPLAKEFGCDPDFNAWDMGKRNPRPKADDPNLRSCGGHIHVGYPFTSRGEAIRMIQAMDKYLGIPSVLMDKGDKRKLLYGKCGAHRLKKYGVEYRTLSNFWIFDDKLIEWVWNNTARALDAVMNGASFDAEKDEIVNAINNNDKELAFSLVNKYNLEVVYA